MTKIIGKNDYWAALKTSVDTSNCEMKSIVTYSNGMLKCIVQLNNIKVTEIYGNPANNVNPFNIVPESFKSTCNYLQKIGRQLSNGCKNPMTNELQFPIEFNGLDKENETPPNLKKNSDGVQKQANPLKKDKSIEKVSDGKNKLKLKKEVNFSYTKERDSKYELINFPSKSVQKDRNKNENLQTSKIAFVQKQLEQLRIMKKPLKQDNCEDRDGSSDSVISENVISESTSSNGRSTGKPKHQEKKLKDSKKDKKEAVVSFGRSRSNDKIHQNLLLNQSSDEISDGDSSSEEDTDFSESSSEITEDIDEINEVSLEPTPSQFNINKKPMPNKKPTGKSITVRRLDLLRNTITKIQNKAVESSISIHHNFEHKRIDENNLGFQMMKTIGWTGDALGKNSTGITEPIGFTINNGRSGFGASTSISAPEPTESSTTNQQTAAASPSLSSKKNKSKKSRDKDKMKSISNKIIRNFLLAYAEDSKQTNNLVISSGFTKKEIKSLKRAAKGYGLGCIGRTDDDSKSFSLIIAKPADYTIGQMDKHKQKDNNKRNRRARRRNIQNLWALKGGQSNE